MSTDYHVAQGDFSSIVYRLQPMVLSNFVMWLDLKVAEFKVYGQMLLDAETDVNSTKWFLRAGSDKSVSSHSTSNENTVPIGGKVKRTATTIQSKANSEIHLAPPTKHARKTVCGEAFTDSKTNLEFDQLPMIQNLSNIQEEVNSFLIGKGNSDSSTSSMTKNVLETGNENIFPLSPPNSSTCCNGSGISQNDSTIKKVPQTTHISSIPQESSMFEKQENSDNSIHSDIGYFSVASKKSRSPTAIQKGLDSETHSQKSQTFVAGSDSLPLSIENIKMEPIDSEFTSPKNDLADLSLCTDSNRPMAMVPNLPINGDNPNNIDTQATQIFTQSDGTTCMFITKPEGLNTEEDRTNDFQQAKKTEELTRFAVKKLKDFLKAEGKDENFETLGVIELRDLLDRFYCTVRNLNGECYSKHSLITIRQGLKRYIQSAPFSRGFDIITDQRFQAANSNFNIVLKTMSDTKRMELIKMPVSEQDMNKLYFDSDVFSIHTPQGLLNKVWFECMIYFGRKGKENVRNWTKNDFHLEVDATGRQYIVKMKSIPTRLQLKEEVGRMYATGTATCPFLSFNFYVSRRNPECLAFFQLPRDSVDQKGLVWFRNRPLGKNSLCAMMPEISRQAQLSQMYRNCCCRVSDVHFLSELLS
ncbi:hypothetical protein ScPMuIL_003842 [Solemya velum]